MGRDVLQVKEAPCPGGQTHAGDAFPFAQVCASSGAHRDDVLAWVSTNRDRLHDQSLRSGAILFRGFPLASVEDFDAFVASFGYPDFTYADSLSNAVRVNLTERVFTANEAPAAVQIRLHHEMAQTPIYPRRLFFCCLKPADRGGATALCRSDVLFEELTRERPAFARACREKGLRYHNVMPPEDDPGSGMGRSWKSTFSVESKDAAEARMRGLGYSWEWAPDGCLHTTTPTLPAVRDLADGRTSFFNQLIAALSWEDSRNDPSNAITFGDGTPIDPEAASLTTELAEQLSVDLTWEQGDVALVDNYLVMHGRRTFEGTRRVVAAFTAVDDQ